jgi:hypothetical protein
VTFDAGAGSVPSFAVSQDIAGANFVVLADSARPLVFALRLDSNRAGVYLILLGFVRDVQFFLCSRCAAGAGREQTRFTSLSTLALSAPVLHTTITSNHVVLESWPETGDVFKAGVVLACVSVCLGTCFFILRCSSLLIFLKRQAKKFHQLRCDFDIPPTQWDSVSVVAAETPAGMALL